VRVRENQDQVSWSDHLSQLRYNGPSQDCWRYWVARSDEQEGSAVLPRNHQLLMMVYLRLLRTCPHSSTWPEMIPVGAGEKPSTLHSLGWRKVSLPLWDPTKPFCIEADSSDFAMCAVLSQISSEDQKWHLDAFLSKSLSPVEWNYELHDKEMLAIIRALQEWWHFIKGMEHQCKILIDTRTWRNAMASSTTTVASMSQTLPTSATG